MQLLPREGNAQAKQELEPVLQKMGATDDWKNLIPVDSSRDER